MNPREFTELWGQYTSGGDLADNQVLAMEQLLESDAILCAEVAEDHHLHRMLQHMGTIHESQDEFVSGVVAACTGLDNPCSSLLPAESDQQERRFSGLSVLAGLAAVAVGVLVFASITHNELSRARARTDLAIQLANEAKRQAEEARDLSRGPADAPAEAANQPSEPSPVETLPPAERVEHVAIISNDDPETVWRGNVVGPRLGPGNFELVSGQPILKLSGGSVVSVRGPARFTLHHATHLSLYDGEIEVQVAADDVGFRVTTSNSRVIDLGTAFRVSVVDSRTHVTLDSGEVVVIPWRSGQGQPRVHLRSGEYEEAVIHGPADESDGPEASYTAGPAGFRGSVRLDELSFELTSLERFNCVRDGIFTSFRSDPEQTKADWLRATTVLSRVTGSMTVEGTRQTIRDLDSLLRAEARLIPADTVTGPVTGKFDVAGKEHRFQSRAEYNQIRKRVLESLEALGIRSLPEMVREQDLKMNPFRR